MSNELKLALVKLCQESLKFALKKIQINGPWGKLKVSLEELALGAPSEPHIISDAESEWGMISVIHDFGRVHHICFIIRGEEVGDGVLQVGDTASAVVITVCMDGIDGTGSFLKGLPAGPMLAFAWGDNPRYKDFFVAGVGNITDSSMVIGDGILGKVSQINEIGEVKDLLPISHTSFDQHTCVVNISTQICRDVSGGARDTHGGSTAWVAYQIVTHDPSCQALLLDATRKNNLEQPAFYLLVTLAGGLYVTLTGESLQDKLFLEWMRSPKLDSVGDGNQTIICAVPNRSYLDYAQSLYLK